MQRYDFFFRQKVEEGELDAAFQAAEDAVNRSFTDLAVTGVVAGLDVVQQASPNLTVQVQGPGVTYDQVGQRIAIAATQNVDCSVDENALNTAVAAPGNSKWLSVFIEFDRVLTDPRLDGNASTVYYDRDESFTFRIAAGAESVTPSRPALRGDQILLADISLAYGQTTIVNANISTTRRQDAFIVAGSPRSVAARTLLAAITQLLGFYNNHVTGAADPHDAGALNYLGGGAWADGTTNPAATVEAQLDKIIADLSPTATSSSGARKIGMEQGPAWADASTTAAGTLQAFLAAVITALASTTASSSGARKLGIEALANWADGTTNTATTLFSMLSTNIVTRLAATTGGNSGAAKLGIDALGNWANGTTNPAGTLRAIVAKIVSDLASTAADSGAHKVGIDALGNWADATASVAAGVLRTGIAKIVSDLAGSTGTAKIGGAIVSGAKGNNLVQQLAAAQLSVQLAAILARLETDRLRQAARRALDMRVAVYASGTDVPVDYAYTDNGTFGGAFLVLGKITAATTQDLFYLSRKTTAPSNTWTAYALATPNNYDMKCAYADPTQGVVLVGGNKDSASGASLQSIATSSGVATVVTPTGMTTTTDTILDLIWTGTRWIAVGSGANIINTTNTFGASGWAAAAGKPAGSAAINALAYSPSLTRVVCVMNSAIWYSNDHGQNWTAAGGAGITGNFYAVAWDAVNGVFIAGGTRISTSADGITWAYAAIDATAMADATAITGVAVDETGTALMQASMTLGDSAMYFIVTQDGGATAFKRTAIDPGNLPLVGGTGVPGNIHSVRYVGGRFFATHAIVGKYLVSDGNHLGDGQTY